MKEYGLLFVAAMARAAVAGIKTQTRRLPTASNSLVDGVGISAKRWADMRFDWSRAVVDKGPSPAGNPGPYLHVPAGNGETWHRIYPRYQVGDRIWGRESFRFADSLDRYSPVQVSEVCLGAGYTRPWAPTVYAADGTRANWEREFSTPGIKTEPGRLRPSLHMPRWAARIVRDIVGVRVERLQDISEADALEEGVTYNDLPNNGLDPRRARTWYCGLWNAINGPGSWDANPPVIVIEFAGVQS